MSIPVLHSYKQSSGSTSGTWIQAPARHWDRHHCMRWPVDTHTDDCRLRVSHIYLAVQRHLVHDTYRRHSVGQSPNTYCHPAVYPSLLSPLPGRYRLPTPTFSFTFLSRHHMTPGEATFRCCCVPFLHGLFAESLLAAGAIPPRGLRFRRPRRHGLVEHFRRQVNELR